LLLAGVEPKRLLQLPHRKCKAMTGSGLDLEMSSNKYSANGDFPELSAGLERD